MKAGIYETPNGNLIYVAKDRTIKATTLSPSSWPGLKVSHRSSDDTVLIADTGYRCTRKGDVPNGCTDHAKALQDFAENLSKPQLGDIVLRFEDNGQDFLRWTLRDDEHGFTRVVDSQPFQRGVWYGLIVHNADNLVRGTTNLAHVGREPGDSYDLRHRVIEATRVMSPVDVAYCATASEGENMRQFSTPAPIRNEDAERQIAMLSAGTFTFEADPVAAAALFGSRPYPKDTTICAMMLAVEDREADALYPYQREALKQFEQRFCTGGVPGMREGEVAALIGESGTTEYRPRDGFAEERKRHEAYIKEHGVYPHERETEKPRLGLVALDFAEAEKLVEAYRAAHPKAYEAAKRKFLPAAGDVVVATEGPTSDFSWIGTEKRIHALPRELGAPYAAVDFERMAGALGEMTNVLAVSSRASKDAEIEVRVFTDTVDMRQGLVDVGFAYMRAEGWRPVHRQSARKHRRKGHEVRDAFGRTWWRPQA